MASINEMINYAQYMSGLSQQKPEMQIIQAISGGLTDWLQQKKTASDREKLLDWIRKGGDMKYDLQLKLGDMGTITASPKEEPEVGKKRSAIHPKTGKEAIEIYTDGEWTMAEEEDKMKSTDYNRVWNLAEEIARGALNLTTFESVPMEEVKKYLPMAEKYLKGEGFTESQLPVELPGIDESGAIRDQGKIKVLSPDGKVGTIPKEQLQEALKAGYKLMR